MSPLALLEFRLEELTVIEPLRIKHIAIHIIVKYPDLPVIPRIENIRLIVVERVMPQRFPNDSRQAFTTVAHVNGLGTEIEPDTVAEQKVSTQFRAYPCFRALYQCPKGYVLNI